MGSSAKEQSVSTTTVMLHGASVTLTPSAVVIPSSLEITVLSDAWWIKTYPVDVFHEELYTYDLGIVSILETHGNNKCDGLKNHRPCVICNVKHEDAQYGILISKLGEKLKNNPFDIPRVEFDGFDPNEYTEAELRELAAHVIKGHVQATQNPAYSDPMIEWVEKKLRKDGQLFHE